MNRDIHSFIAIRPNASFYSTSTLVGSGSSYAATPLLGEDGLATTYSETETSVAPHGGARRAGGTGVPVTPGNGGVKQPIGDALIPLMLIAFIYAFFAIRRKTKA